MWSKLTVFFTTNAALATIGGCDDDGEEDDDRSPFNWLRVVPRGEGVCDPTKKSTLSTTGRKSGDLSITFEEILQIALGSNDSKTQKLYKEAEKCFAGEMFRFYAAILDWEKEAKKGDSKRSQLQASKIVSTFVECGSRYENGCLSSSTRQQLLCRKGLENAKQDFFAAAKYEVAKDIMMNSPLKNMVELLAKARHQANSNCFLGSNNNVTQS
jgi:hypothetical protein